MKGYKALNQNMRAIYGNGMQFELGKIYSVEGEVVPCKNGFHFCDKIEELNSFYRIKESRIFEVEAYGGIKKEEGKYIAEEIKLVRELTKKEIKGYFKENQQSLAKSSNWYVRQAVAEQGYGLDELIYDEDFYVRRLVAEQGYGLDILIHDENDCVSQTAKKMMERR